MPPSSEFLHEAMSLELNNAVSALRQSSRGVSREHLEVQLTASKWLIEALYQGYCCLPRLPVALPRRSNDYFGNASYKLPYRFVVIDRILQAAKKLNFIQVLRGKYNPFGKGVVTRLYPAGPLLTHFRQIGTVWQKLSPPSKDQGIFINEDRGSKGRRLAEIADHPDVVRMQRTLYKINLFLSKQCIYINLPDSAFDQPADKFVKPEASGSDAKKGSRDSLPTINFQSVFLSRIFTQDSFKVGHRLEGGRFYHGWWQRIRKEFRPRIMINDFITAECDYSGMALSCLYAMEGLDVGNQDPYEIGLKYTSKDDPRRDLVKQYVVAILNDESGKYRLNQQQLNVVGLTHQQLRDMVRKRHSAISHHFGTGVGLHLQYIDSCVAESVMLKFIRKKEVCLPIHDSFIVRRGLLKELEMVMRDEFRKQLRSSIGLKKTDLAISGLHIGRPDINLPASSVPSDPAMDIAMRFMTHISQYSILMGLHSSWEKQVFSPVELEGRSRMREEVFDFGKRNPV
jgi:hypothetical protein